METKSKECSAVEELLRKLSAGEAVSEREREFVEAHLRKCDSCRTERCLFRVLAVSSAEDSLAVPLEPLERSLAVRSMVEGYLAGLRPSRRQEPGRGRRHVRSVLVPLASAAVLLLAAGYLVFQSGLFKHDRAPGKDMVAMIVSGDVKINGMSKPAGAILGAGDMVVARDGFFVLSVEEDFTIWVKEHTALIIGDMLQGTQVFKLEKGHIIAGVDRQADRQQEEPRLKIIAGDAELFDAGTVFSVAMESDGTVLKVHEGEVRVRKTSGETYRVGKGKKFFMDHPARGAVDFKHEEFAEAMEAARRLASDVGYPELCHVNVTSVPGGADVRIEGVPVGKTPLQAMVNPGETSLELSLPGHETVQVQLDLERGGRLDKSFVLVPLDMIGEQGGAPGEDDASGIGVPAQDETKAGKPGSTERPAELLKLARKRRAAKDWDGAADAYKKLIRLFPSSSEARVSLKSLGDIYLNQKNSPSAALACYKKYRKENPKGNLVREASYGIIKCYRKMGKTEMERKEIKKFIDTYTGDVYYSGKLRERLKQLEGGL